MSKRRETVPTHLCHHPLNGYISHKHTGLLARNKSTGAVGRISHAEIPGPLNALDRPVLWIVYPPGEAGVKTWSAGSLTADSVSIIKEKP